MATPIGHVDKWGRLSTRVSTLGARLSTREKGHHGGLRKDVTRESGVRKATQVINSNREGLV